MVGDRKAVRYVPFDKVKDEKERLSKLGISKFYEIRATDMYGGEIPLGKSNKGNLKKMEQNISDRFGL